MHFVDRNGEILENPKREGCKSLSEISKERDELKRLMLLTLRFLIKDASQSSSNRKYLIEYIQKALEK